MERNWLIVVQRSSLVSDLHQISAEEGAEEDHLVIGMGATVVEVEGDMEIGHHTGPTRAFVREWIREMTGTGVIRWLRQRKFAFKGVCGLEVFIHVAALQWRNLRL
jgi:hypothetical protein